MDRTAKVFAGLDWGSAKSSLAIWDATLGRPQIVPASPGKAYVPARVAFQEISRGGRRVVEPLFPLPDGWQEDSNSLEFWEIKNHFAAFGDVDAQKAIARPVFDFWRRILGPNQTQLSVSVPLGYSWESSSTLSSAGSEAGFDRCEPVTELLATVLAYLPYWQKDSTHWGNLEGARSVWVIDCGSRDLNLGLVLVQRRPREVQQGPSRLDFALLAADCLEGFGARCPDAGPERVTAAVARSLPNLVKAAFERSLPDWQGSKPEAKRADWIVCAGGGAHLAPAKDAVKTQLQPLLGNSPLVWEKIPPTDVVATGAAVHAAILGGQLPIRIGVARRWILGVRVELPEDQNFIEISWPDDEPPFDFERAFKVPGRAEKPVAITLSAALPGGDRFVSVCTFQIEPGQFLNSQDPVLLVAGHLEDWAQGTVCVREVNSGTKLYEKAFRLP